jgi:phosphatidylglycerophosphate synthase
MVNKLLEKYECPINMQLYKFIDTHLHMYYHIGLTPNMVTTFSIIFAFFSAHQILKGHFLFAAILMLFSYYLDCVDGKLARKYNMVSKFGDLYDHFGDILKLTVVAYALFKSNKEKTSIKQRIYIGIIVIFSLIQCIHLSYQEVIYDKKEESACLNIFRQIIYLDPNPEKNIQYAKYIGSGTWMLCCALLIIFWKK